MPEEFDPTWEYWEPDPEIAEAMSAAAVNPLAALGLEGEYGDRIAAYRPGGTNLGFRYSHGNPDAEFIDPDPDPFPIGREYERKTRPRVVCGWCRIPFQTTSTRKSLCPKCAPTSGSPRISDRVCVECGGTFRPRERRYSRFCSHRCANAHCNPAAPPKAKGACGPVGRPRTLMDRTCPAPECGGSFRPHNRGSVYCSRACALRSGALYRPKKIDDVRFTELYRAGVPLAAIAREFGVTATACRNARRRLGLAAAVHS